MQLKSNSNTNMIMNLSYWSWNQWNKKYGYFLFFQDMFHCTFPRNKFVLNMIGNQNNNAFKDWVIVTTDFLFFNTRWENSLWNRNPVEAGINTLCYVILYFQTFFSHYAFNRKYTLLFYVFWRGAPVFRSYWGPFRLQI